jgi:hypothetical protein
MDNFGQLKIVGHHTFQQTRWMFALFASIHHLLAFSWFLMLFALYAFSWRVQAVIGHWPQPYFDDPTYSALGDRLSGFLNQAVFLFFLMTLVSIVAVPYFSRYLQYRFSRFWPVVLLAVYVAGFIVYMIGLADRGEWYWG